MLNLKGKYAIVTGGGTGIGRSIALHLAKEGCNLILTGLGEDDLVKVKEECEALGVKAWATETLYQRAERMLPIFSTGSISQKKAIMRVMPPSSMSSQIISALEMPT